MLRLKQSKIDTEHTEVQIILAATGKKTCPVAALERLYTLNPQYPDALLFRLTSGAFSRNSMVSTLKKRISRLGLSQSDYSGYSFRKGAAQHAAGHGMLDEMIERLGRWTSNAFRLYFTTSPESLYNLNFRFQKSMSLAVPRAVVPPSMEVSRAWWGRSQNTKLLHSAATPTAPTTSSLWAFLWGERPAKPSSNSWGSPPGPPEASS